VESRAMRRLCKVPVNPDHYLALLGSIEREIEFKMASVDAKLLRQTKFPAEFNQKVDMTKVNVEVMKK
jgi:hypothetical protein